MLTLSELAAVVSVVELAVFVALSVDAVVLESEFAQPVTTRLAVIKLSNNFFMGLIEVKVTKCEERKLIAQTN